VEGTLIMAADSSGDPSVEFIIAGWQPFGDGANGAEVEFFVVDDLANFRRHGWYSLNQTAGGLAKHEA
jgi:hypothetical protein